MATHKTVFDEDFEIISSDKQFDYQKDLTAKLDDAAKPFDQAIINEIVLWKVNRYAQVDDDTLKSLNEIDTKSNELNVEVTRNILKKLVQKKGIKLPMASAILRFRNNNIYQIIDQRVYRIIYKNKKLKLKTHPNEKNLNDQVDLYIEYLRDLKDLCKKLEIPFAKADRILFVADKRINKNIPIDNYSAKRKEKA